MTSLGHRVTFGKTSLSGPLKRVTDCACDEPERALHSSGGLAAGVSADLMGLDKFPPIVAPIITFGILIGVVLYSLFRDAHP